MIFTILNEDFTFNLQIDSNGRLTSFTATKVTNLNLTSTNYNCSIQVENESNPLEVFCCGPSGCTVGPCIVS